MVIGGHKEGMAFQNLLIKGWIKDVFQVAGQILLPSIVNTRQTAGPGQCDSVIEH